MPPDEDERAPLNAIVVPGGFECPRCGGSRFIPGGNLSQRVIWGLRASDRFLVCTNCDEVLRKRQPRLR